MAELEGTPLGIPERPGELGAVTDKGLLGAVTKKDTRIAAVVGPRLPSQSEEIPPLPQQMTALSPSRAEHPDERMLSGLQEYTAVPPAGRWSGEPSATDRYAMMRTRQGQNALVAAAGQPLLFRPSVSMKVNVEGASYKVEVSEDGTFISGPGLLTGGTGLDEEKLRKVVVEIKSQVGLPGSSLDEWAKARLSALTGENPQPIPPKEIALAEQVAQSQILSLAQKLEEGLEEREGGPPEDLARLVHQLRVARDTEVVYKDIFSSSGTSQEYVEDAYDEPIRQRIEESVTGFVRGGVAWSRGQIAGRPAVERAAIRMEAAAEIPLEEIGGEDFHDSDELMARPSGSFVGAKDKDLGLSRTRESSSFRESWFVDGQVVADEKIQIIETRRRAEAGVKKAIQELGERTDEEAVVRREALEKMLKTLNRDQSFLHATGLREMVQMATKPGSRITIEDICFAEPPDLVKDSVVVGATGKSFDIIRVGAISDHLNSAVSLKLLQTAVNGVGQTQTQAIAEIGRIRQQLEDRLNTEKLTVQQRAVLEHMIRQLDISNPETLRKTLIERREILRQQALQLVATQVGEAGSRLQSMGKLHVAHTSLLYPGKKSWDKSGIAHDEQCMIEDMEQIFTEFNGKEIHLDAGIDAPYIDAEGVIHVPRPRGVSKESVSLATHYVNLTATHELSPEQALGQKELAASTIGDLRAEISAQRDPIMDQQAAAQRALELARTANDSDQIQQAQQAVQEADERVSNLVRATTLLNEVEATLDGTTTYHTAAKLLEVQKVVGWFASTGCYSDKDRGGLTGRTVLTNMVAHSMQNEAATLQQQIDHAEKEKRSDDVARLNEEEYQLQRRARKLMDDNPYAAFAPDSCQMRFIQHVVKRPQHYLKAWLGIKKGLKIAQVCLPLFARARWSELREAAKKAGHEVSALTRLHVRRLEEPPAQEMEPI